MSKRDVKRKGNVVYLGGPIEEPIEVDDRLGKTDRELLEECTMKHLLEVTGLADLVNLQRPKLHVLAGGV